MFRIRSLGKRFGSISALEDIHFEVRAGEVLGLIGPNGAGKTTLFECLSGVLPVDSGEMHTGAAPINATDRSRLLFYVPDGVAPWPEQEVEWALDFAIGFFGGRRARRGETIEQLDLGHLLHQRIGTLSKGERKRVLIGIGLLTPQPVLLIDEPLDGLDLRQAREISSVLKSHASRGRTIFCSIHQIGDAARFCDRFVLLSDGRVRGEGTLAELARLADARDPAKRHVDLEEVFLALT